MDPLVPITILAFCVGCILGVYLGAWAAARNIRKRNQAIAQEMAASVGARRSTTKVEDMMSYESRQRTSAPNNGQKARQGNVVFRPRRMARRR